ncbi:hypothetical protein [Senegalia massiliensis]|nr:hypothetical protein [Senegalia massiliensis]
MHKKIQNKIINKKTNNKLNTKALRNILDASIEGIITNKKED